ncbi:MAG: hypothetical protein A2017_00785 [Lentisphaerae bacterium GWF2_44_16]|nr:MAG: hypothetical protein A2017_00785 [Lentisphaerae bacterium GWF2_44_16]
MFKKISITLLSGLILSQSTMIFARPGGGPGPAPAPRPNHWDGHSPNRWYGPGPNHWYGPRPGFPYVPVICGGLSLLYSAGLFYQCVAGDYVVVTPPYGAIVPALPTGYSICVINGVTYYYYNSIYYNMSANGYVVVNPPVTVVQPTPVVTVQSAPVVQQVQQVQQPVQTVTQTAPVATPAPVQQNNTYDVHIPNGNGSYTVVRLKKLENGFLGPQGEFYSDHPTEAQLKARYVKQ